MKEELLGALQTYQRQADQAFSLFERKFGPLHELRKGLTPIPKSGFLDDGRVAYHRHGAGCRFALGEEEVDFDFTFTENGPAGFPLGWIRAYLSTHKEQHPRLASLGDAALKAMLDELVASGRVRIGPNDVSASMMLYFIP